MNNKREFNGNYYSVCITQRCITIKNGKLVDKEEDDENNEVIYEPITLLTLGQAEDLYNSITPIIPKEDGTYNLYGAILFERHYIYDNVENSPYEEKELARK